MTDFLTAAQAAQRLGIKPATLYAYVSRGVLERRKAADGRGSLYDRAEVERLARRGRPRLPAGLAGITVRSAITEITADGLRYRGFDVTRLALTRTFEEVAELLWTGELPSAQASSAPPHRQQTAEPDAGPGWRATPAAMAAGRAAQAALPTGILPLERLQVIVPAIAAADPLRLHLDRQAVCAAGRTIIAGMVDCLPPAAQARSGRVSPVPADLSGPIAERLWTRLCGQQASPALLRALSAALVLLADHELAASTLAARVAASVRADPYAVVGTGLGAVSGALHGGASLGAETLIAGASGPDDVPRAVAELLRRGEKVPGIGHLVYRGGDPRASVLLDLVRHAAPKSDRLAVAEALFAEVRQKSLPAPNVDLALATLTQVGGMVRGAGEAIFAVARTAGWIAHALEAYAADSPMRPRAVYTGRPPADGSTRHDAI
jgi:citrate synthase